MKTVYSCVLVMVIPLIGGCTASDTIDDGPTMGWWYDTRIQPGPPGCPPTTIIRYYVPDSMHPTLLAVKRTLQEIDVKMKDVNKALDVAGKRAPASDDLGIRQSLEEIESRMTEVRASLDTVSRMEHKLEEIDTKIGETRTAVDIASRKVPMPGDIVQIMTYLRPKLDVEMDPNVLCSDNKIRLTFNITNRGEHSVSIGDLQLTLSTECIWRKDAIAEELSPDVDYGLQWESGGFYAAPGQTIKRVADIEIQEAELEEQPLHYSVCVNAETEPEIVEVLSGLLLDSLETDKLYRISRASFRFGGEISPSVFRQPE
ncbi:MAG: hypothetical protein ABIF19_16260 [Planctomycetota bacterium]